jgi:hypothetical protein
LDPLEWLGMVPLVTAARYAYREVTLESPQEALERQEQGELDRKEPRIVLQAISKSTLEEVWQTSQELVPQIGNAIAQLGYLSLKADVE